MRILAPSIFLLFSLTSLAAKEPEQQEPPTTEQREAFCKAKSSYIVVKRGKGSRYPFLATAIEHITKRRNLSGATKRDANLIVTIDWGVDVQREFYETHLGTYGKDKSVPVGTRLSGRITLDAPGVKPFRVKFKGESRGPWSSRGTHFVRDKVLGDEFEAGYVAVIKRLFDFCN